MKLPHVEAELLLLLADKNLRLEKIERIRTLLKKTIDWEKLLLLVTLNKITLLVYFNLKSVCPDLIPPVYLRLLKDRCTALAKKNLSLTQEFFKLLALLSGNNIPVIPLKGPLLALNLYSNLGLREFVDLDFLVPREDLPKVKNILVQNGYKAKLDLSDWQEKKIISCNCELVFENENKSHIDIHWNIAPKCFMKDLDFQYFFDNASVVQFGNETIKSLSPEDLLLILCIQGAKDLWSELKFIVDIATLIQSTNLNWKKLLLKAKKLKAENVLLVGVYLSQVLYRSKVPDIINAKIQSNSSLSSIVEKIVLRLFSCEPRTSNLSKQINFHLSLMDNFFYKIRYCLYLMIFPTVGDWEFLPLPKILSWLYYFLRPIRLLNKYVLNRFKSPKPIRFISTPNELVEEMLTFAHVGSEDVVYDLGCGDGRFVTTAAKKFGAQGVGIDIDHQRINEAKLNAKKENVEHGTIFICNDALKEDISRATVVVLFQHPSVIRQKLIKELRPNVRVISYGNYYFRNSTPSKTKLVVTKNGNIQTLYLWSVEDINL